MRHFASILNSFLRKQETTWQVVGVSFLIYFSRKQLHKFLRSAWEESRAEAPADPGEDGIPGQPQGGRDEEQGEGQQAGDED